MDKNLKTFKTFGFNKEKCKLFSEKLKTDKEKKEYFQHCIIEYEYHFLTVGLENAPEIRGPLSAIMRLGFDHGIQKRVEEVKNQPFYIWCKRQIEIFTSLNFEPGLATSSITKFPQIEGLTWEEVSMEFVSIDGLRIKARNITKTYTYAEIGFKDNRKRALWDSKWEILKDGFARFEGLLDWETPIDPGLRKGLKSAVKELRKRLKYIMSIDDDPFCSYRKLRAYKTRFKIKDCSYPSPR